MIINPIIPIWTMALICILFIFLKSKSKYSFIRRILIIILIFVINLRIMISSPNVKIQTNNLDVLFVIDNTISMVAEDYNGNSSRLSAVQNDCKYIIEQLYGANFSVISFNNSSRIIIPFTKDGNLAIEAIKTIQTMDETYAEGSSLNTALEDTLSVLEGSAKKSDRKRVLFFISDGEITNDDKLKSFSQAKKYVNNGAILGYGTLQGGKMKIKNRYTDEISYIQDESSWPYSIAISKIDESNLKTIASDIGIDYIHMEKQSNISYKLKAIKQDLMKTSGDEEKESFTDIYYIFALPLSLLLIYELISHKRRLLA